MGEDSLAMQMNISVIGKKRNLMRTINHLYIIGNGFDVYHGLPTSYTRY